MTRESFQAYVQLVLFLAACAGSAKLGQAQEISYSRQVLPILAENCYSCHGPDAKAAETDLKFDSREHLLKAVSLDKPSESALLLRVRTQDESQIMPPKASHKKPLTAQQIATLEQWIAQGAPWGRHWSFEPPKKIELPKNGLSHPIDAIVSQRLRADGMALAKPAAWHTRMRRLSFDLTGLPPDEKSLARYRGHDNLDEYIDELLASPHYGERMAMWWLDLARYADTDGFQADATRENWPWRDWVIDAFNRNMPFDQFTLEQFAGDLLPNATDEQKLATCFHRNHMTNGEGGRDPDESRVDYVIDRVNTMGTVWLGLTLGCSQCHSHKFDPVSQSDYYSLSAFFNSINETGKAGKEAEPYLAYKSQHTEHALKEAQALVNERKPIEAQAREAARTEFATGWTSKSLPSATSIKPGNLSKPVHWKPSKVPNSYKSPTMRFKPTVIILIKMIIASPVVPHSSA